MHKPIISVLLPVYNEEKYIKKSIESILAQTFVDFEIIVINDASTDNSSDIIQSFNDPRIKILNNKKNSGIAKSLNEGFLVTKGDYIARMDANDIAIDTRFEKQLQYLQNYPDCVVVFCPVLKIDENGKSLDRIEGKYIPPELIQTYMFYKTCFFHSTVLLRKNKLSNPPYDENNLAEDYGLWVELLQNWELHILDEVLMQVRDLPDGLRFKDECRESYHTTKISNLELLHINPDNEEIDIHLSLGEKTDDTENNIAVKKMKWLDKLYKANKQYSIYNEPYFTAKLIEHWNRLVNNKNNPSLMFFLSYLQSPLRIIAKKPISRTIKLLFSLFYVVNYKRS